MQSYWESVECLSCKFLKHEREWALTTLVGKLFQSFITRFENELSLTFVRALGLQSFKLWRCIGGKRNKSRFINIQHTISTSIITVCNNYIGQGYCHSGLLPTSVSRTLPSAITPCRFFCLLLHLLLKFPKETSPRPPCMNIIHTSLLYALTLAVQIS